MVVLGAGLDTLAYRTASASDVPVYEVDLPVNVARKHDVVARVLGGPPPSVVLVPIDFERDDLFAVLAAHGYPRDARTFFVWEGVTQYLTESAVRATFAQLAGAARGQPARPHLRPRDFIFGRPLRRDVAVPAVPAAPPDLEVRAGTTRTRTSSRATAGG